MGEKRQRRDGKRGPGRQKERLLFDPLMTGAHYSFSRFSLTVLHLAASTPRATNLLLFLYYFQHFIARHCTALHSNALQHCTLLHSIIGLFAASVQYSLETDTCIAIEKHDP